jgi:outer membrane protein assembly factor BamB
MFSSAQGDWPRFRGPNGSRVSGDDAAVPAKWSNEENLVWKTKLPGPGISSPIVVGDRVFVTCYSGYGAEGGEMKDLKRHMVCIDRKTGEVLWDETVEAVLPEDPYSGMGIPSHGYASHSPCSDGEYVFAFFGKSGAVAFDMEGRRIWQSSAGTGSDRRSWGSASSPILYKDLVIVTAAPESESMIAFDKKTGEKKWETKAGGLNSSWSTPVLVRVNDERTDLVIAVPYEIWGLNPNNGKLRWYCDAIETEQFQSSLVAKDGVVYAIEGRGGGSIAVRAGGTDNVTDTHVLWSGRDSNRYGTPVVTDGKLFFVANNIANLLSLESGDSTSKVRLDGGTPQQNGERGGAGRGGEGRVAPGARGQGRGGQQGDAGGGARGDNGQPGRGNFGGQGRGGFGGQGGGFRGGRGMSGDYASPVFADGKLFYTKRSGETFVFKSGEKLEQIAVNKLGDNESFGATPAISHGQLFLRSDKFLYCVGNKK